MKFTNYRIGLFSVCLTILFAAKGIAQTATNHLTLSVENGIKYRDLNNNGKMDTYENTTATIDERVNDLIGKMTLEEKAGLMFIDMIIMDNNGSLINRRKLRVPLTIMLNKKTNKRILEKHMNHFNTLQSPSAEAIAKWNNNIQKLAESTRLGIPVTIATDPRHVAGTNLGATIQTPFFSKWPSSVGLAATRDTALVREFAGIARQEYRALGMSLALSPMADLATEPRWSRINGTFSEDAHLSAEMTKAYVLGFQGNELNSKSVACVTKHFPGGGPQENGEEAHFDYGKYQIYPGDNFDYHLIPFEEGAFAANTAGIMPYYGVPVGQFSEEVGFSFNKEVITGLLREKYQYDGVICTDWGLVNSIALKPAAAWGVENLGPMERVEKIIEAGSDLFGGESCPEHVVELVNTGRVSEDRINQSVKRILRLKFQLGLFDNPYVDENNVSLVGSQEFIEKGLEAQRKSLVLLKNKDNILPLSHDTKIYIEGFSKKQVKNYPNVVSSPAKADIIVQKLKTPYDKRKNVIMERFFHQGRLDFNEKELAKIKKLMDKKPTITVINLERPAVIPEINAASEALIADFDCADNIILDLIYGKFNPTGKLPFELPSSMKAVEKQKEDVPYDSENPLYEYGAGITFE